MIARDIAADMLLGLAVLVVLASCIGLLAMRGVYRKLHFVTPVALVAPLLAAAAIGVQMGLRENTAESWLALAFLVMAGPFLTHATLRAARIRDKGDWRPGPSRRAGDGDGRDAGPDTDGAGQ